MKRPCVEEVAGVVRKQADVGMDIVSDGEYGKAGWIRYVAERLGGFVHRAIRPGDHEQNPVYLIREAQEISRVLRRLHADPVLRLAAAGAVEDAAQGGCRRRCARIF